MHKKEFRELICAMLLGDGYLRVGQTKGHTSGCFWAEHSRAQFDYVQWKVEQIDKIFIDKNLPRRCRTYTRDRLDKRTNKVYYSCSLCFNWKTYLTFLRKKTYRYDGNVLHKNVKYLLNNISTDKHVAIWFMDDVSESRTKKYHKNGDEYYISPAFRLATQSFTPGEVQLIREWFRTNYGMYPAINKQHSGLILRFSVEDTKKLFPKIRPYISQIPSMRTKFRLCFERC